MRLSKYYKAKSPKRKRKYKALKKVARFPRGGFTPYAPAFRPRLPYVIDTKPFREIGKAYKEGGSNKARAALMAAAKAAGRAIKESNVTLTLTTDPSGTSTRPVKIPLSEEKSMSRISGGNGTWNAKIHKVHVKAGRPAGKYLRDSMQLLGERKYRRRDTRYAYPDGNARKALTLSYGFNEKFVGAVGEELFGFTYSQVRSDIGYATWTTPTEKLQRNYASVTCLRSIMELTNNNKVLPMTVKCNLVRTIDPGQTFHATLNNCTSASLTAQRAGAMPLAYQQTVPSTKSGGFIRELMIDPYKAALHGAPNSLALYEIEKSITTRLAAGDKLHFTYDHEFKSGINMEELYSENYLGPVNEQRPYTYMLLLEIVGPKTEAVQLDNTGAAITDQRYSGTGPGHFSTEFQQYVIGVQRRGVPVPETGTTGQIQSDRFDLRTFTRDIDGDPAVINRVKKFTYTDLNVPNGFELPLITDTQVTKGGVKVAS